MSTRKQLEEMVRKAAAEPSRGNFYARYGQVGEWMTRHDCEPLQSDDNGGEA